MTLVLDSGAFIALERNDRAMWRRLKSALLVGDVPLSHGGVVGQVWRGRSGRQAVLGKALDAVRVVALDRALGKMAGELLHRARKNDVIDAALVLLAADGDRVITSDPDDLEDLAAASGRHIEIVRA